MFTKGQIEMKTCTRCGFEKELLEFPKDRSRKDGHVSHCKVCRQELSAVRYAEKRDEIQAQRLGYRSANRHLAREYTKEWSAANPLKRKAAKQAYRARKRGADGAHTGEDIATLLTLQKGRCAMCADDIKKTFQVDHIVPLAMGGTNDRLNLQLLCGSCNASKGARDPLLVAQRLGRLL